MRLVAFGTYDVRRHPRMTVIIEGLRSHGLEIEECNIPLAVETARRVGGLARPWRLVGPALRLSWTWARLWRRGRRIRSPDVVIVGYLGSIDIHLARLLWRRTPLVLDQLTFAGDTARDRGVGRPWIVRSLDRLDRSAVSAADTVVVDTEESLDLIPSDWRHRGLVVPVGAPESWFSPPKAPRDGPLRVVFFGLYTPLQGATVIGEAMALLRDAPIEWTMIGSGQDLEATRRRAGSVPRATWIDWVDADELPSLVAGHDVCLGIFGTGVKALRVVPNKVYQGAAAGCAVVTSDTPPQRRALGDAGLYVPAGDASALKEMILSLAADRDRCREAGESARHCAETAFRSATVVTPLVERLGSRSRDTGMEISEQDSAS